MFIPYNTEVAITKWPVGNLLLMAGCVLFFVAMVAGIPSESVLLSMILNGWNPSGLVGHMFIHGGVVHIIFNMLFLWVFGNAVCEKVGSVVYAGIFFATGLVAAVVHNLMDGMPAVGASGAINGIIGFYLVLYPINRVNCFYWILRPGTFDITGFWLILFWFAGDAWMAFSGASTGIAYWAHLGGFVAGFSLAFIALQCGLARMADYDNPTLLDYLRRQAQPARTRRPSGAVHIASSARQPHTPPRPSAPAPLPATEPSPAHIHFDCPHCGEPFDAPAALIGRDFSCSACNGALRLEEE